MNRPSLLHSAEFVRISNLPRRRYAHDGTFTLDVLDLTTDLTRLLKTPHGTQTLKPVQALALREAWAAGGLFAPMGVGCGKTLVSLLLPAVMGAKRPVLLVAAKLDNPGRRTEILEYCKHWRINVPTIVRFETLSTARSKDILDQHDPDLLIIDESHRFKNARAARTRRLRRFLRDHPMCRVCAMTGTITKRSLHDYAHVLAWCLGAGAPVPLRQDVLEEWSFALDERLDWGSQIEPGALLGWCSPGEVEQYGELNAARRAYRRRLEETPGVVVWSEDELTSHLTITEVRLENSVAVEKAFEGIRDLWVLPDGTEIVEAVEYQRHARTLPLGYWLKWKYPTPSEWLSRRKAWAAFQREVLGRSHTLDSPLEVERAYPDAPELVAWRGIKDTYEPETTVVWIDGTPLARAAEWLKHGGVAFCENTAFGEALAHVARVPYFGAGGEDMAGRSIEHFTGKACVASAQANSEGRNLQRFSRMLFDMPPQNGPAWQQRLGRLQRPGQEADEVTCDVLIGCYEHLASFWQARADAEYALHSVGNSQLILDADIEVTEMGHQPSTKAWRK